MHTLITIINNYSSFRLPYGKLIIEKVGKTTYFNVIIEEITEYNFVSEKIKIKINNKNITRYLYFYDKPLKIYITHSNNFINVCIDNYEKLSVGPHSNTYTLKPIRDFISKYSITLVNNPIIESIYFNETHYTITGQNFNKSSVILAKSFDHFIFSGTTTFINSNTLYFYTGYNTLDNLIFEIDSENSKSNSYIFKKSIKSFVSVQSIEKHKDKMTKYYIKLNKAVKNPFILLFNETLNTYSKIGIYINCKTDKLTINLKTFFDVNDYLQYYGSSLFSILYTVYIIDKTKITDSTIKSQYTF